MSERKESKQDLLTEKLESRSSVDGNIQRFQLKGDVDP